MIDLTKVVVVARGRTGSTVITDELGKTSFSSSLQEVFTAQEVFKIPDLDDPPLRHFNTWRKHRGAPSSPEEDLARTYLDQVERRAAEGGRTALFWKVLSQHFVERPYLPSLLAARGYKAIVLRRNPARQAVSGMVAAQRGAYNSTVRLDNFAPCCLDVATFTSIVQIELYMAAHDSNVLEQHGIDHIVVEYENYIADRVAFFKDIFEKLALPVETPAPSDFVIMIDDVEQAVSNYADIKAAAAELGLAL